jgi:hypothetical protein
MLQLWLPAEHLLTTGEADTARQRSVRNHGQESRRASATLATVAAWFVDAYQAATVAIGLIGLVLCPAHPRRLPGRTGLTTPTTGASNAVVRHRAPDVRHDDRPLKFVTVLVTAFGAVLHGSHPLAEQAAAFAANKCALVISDNEGNTLGCPTRAN